MTPAIDVRGVVKRYGAFEALRGVSLSIEQGEFFGLLGPNGAGKTSLISVIAGLSRASAGSVEVMGHDVVDDFRAARSSLGVVPQELVFDPFFTVRETLRISSGYYGIRRNDDWIDEILENLDLRSKADENMRALSGGMKRRVLVAQALVHRPPVIVLDEPTAGVDVELRQGLWQFVRRLNASGHTIVLTTHYLEEAQELCGRIAMLKQGSLVALDRTDSLLRRFAGARLQLRLSGAPIPAQLEKLRVADAREPREGDEAAETRRGDGVSLVTLRIDDYDQVEPVLRALRENGSRIEEMDLQRTDLEEVFVQVMKETR